MEALAEPVWVLPCGFDNQAGNIEKCDKFFTDLASGFETSHGDDDLNRLVDSAVDFLGSDDPGAEAEAEEFSNRLAVDLLLQAAALEPERTIDWWPVFAEAKEGDLMLLLLSPAPIPRSILDEIAANDGRLATSQALMAELVRGRNGATQYGDRLDTSSFDDLMLNPFRRFAGGGLFGFGRLMADPEKTGTTPVGQVEAFQRVVNPVELGLPSMNHRLESGKPYWSVNRCGARKACFVKANSSEVRAKVDETIARVPSVVQFEPPVASSGWKTGQVDLPEGFKLIRELGEEAGNNAVFLVSSGNSEIALKRLDKHLVGQDLQLALAASKVPELQDERLVWYDESFEFAGDTWLRMPFRGHSLQSMRTGMGLAAVLGVLVDLGEVLAKVHKAGYSWGDIKPLNTLVDGNGRGYLADPDLLKNKREPTKSGTPAYMSQDPDFFNDDLLAFVRTSLVALEGTFRMEQGEQIALSPDRPPSWVEPGSLDAREWQVLVDDFGLGQAWVKPGERPSTAPGTIDEATELLRTAKNGVERWHLATEMDLRIAQDLVKDRV